MSNDRFVNAFGWKAATTISGSKVIRFEDMCVSGCGVHRLSRVRSREDALERSDSTFRRNLLDFLTKATVDFSFFLCLQPTPKLIISMGGNASSKAFFKHEHVWAFSIWWRFLYVRVRQDKVQSNPKVSNEIFAIHSLLNPGRSNRLSCM